MTFQVFQEDGFGNTLGENGNLPVKVDVDDVNFPLENITNYDSYMYLKPPEREVKIKDGKLEEVLGSETTSRFYARHSNEKKYPVEQLIIDIYVILFCLNSVYVVYIVLLNTHGHHNTREGDLHALLRTVQQGSCYRYYKWNKKKLVLMFATKMISQNPFCTHL